MDTQDGGRIERGMIKYFCDRCDKEIGDSRLCKMFQVTVESPVMGSLIDVKTGTYILCYDCVRELNKFIERKANRL